MEIEMKVGDFGSVDGFGGKGFIDHDSFHMLVSHYGEGILARSVFFYTHNPEWMYYLLVEDIKIPLLDDQDSLQKKRVSTLGEVKASIKRGEFFHYIIYVSGYYLLISYDKDRKLSHISRLDPLSLENDLYFDKSGKFLKELPKGCRVSHLEKFAKK